VKNRFDAEISTFKDYLANQWLPRCFASCLLLLAFPLPQPGRLGYTPVVVPVRGMAYNLPNRQTDR
jgi:hypothetical protein